MVVQRSDRPKDPRKPASTGSLTVRLDPTSKASLVAAARLRRISVSDYRLAVAVSQARREVEAARQQVDILSPAEQLAFWTALNEPPKLTEAQRHLGLLMRGD